MNNRRWITNIGLALISLVLLAAVHGCARERRGHVDLEDSNIATVGDATILIEDRTQSLETTVQEHREPSSSLVYLSWFPDSRTEMFADIRPDGNGGKGILKDGKATYHLEPISLTAAKTKEIENLLAHLPPSVANVPQGQAVLVSYHDKSDWETRGYNRFSLPEEVLRIYTLSGAAITVAQPAGPR